MTNTRSQVTAKELLRRYADGERTFDSIILWNADLCGADLRKIVLTGAWILKLKASGGNLSEARLDGAYLEGADLTNCNLREVNLSGASLEMANMAGSYARNANLSRANLVGANLESAILQGSDLDLSIMGLHPEAEPNPMRGQHADRPATLRKANFQATKLRKADLTRVDCSQANFRSADLSYTNFEGAIFDGVNLSEAVLLNCNLKSISGTILNRSGCRINFRTYQESAWGSNQLADWHFAGSIIEDFDQFPVSLRMAILDMHEGLTLYFNTRLTPIDRFLVDGIIFGVLGKDTDCQVVAFRQHDDNATIRLQAKRREDLETVAEALYRRVWEQQERGQEQALVKMASLLGPHAMLSDLRRRLDRVELHLEQKQAWRWELGRDHLQFAHPVRLFFSYATEDEHHRRDLEGHLATLKRQGVIDSWHGGMIQAGQVRDFETLQHLEAADIVLLLVSADFMRSDALDEQMRHAWARHDTGQAQLIPVLVRTVDLVGSPLSELQVLPEGGLPVTRWDDQDSAWANVASGIRRVVMGRAIAAPVVTQEASNQKSRHGTVR